MYQLINSKWIIVLASTTMLLIASCEDPTEKQIRKIQEYYENLDHYTDIVDGKVGLVRNIELHSEIAIDQKWTSEQWLDKIGNPKIIYDGLGDNVSIMHYQEDGPFFQPQNDLVIGASVYFENGIITRIGYINYESIDSVPED